MEEPILIHEQEMAEAAPETTPETTPEPKNKFLAPDAATKDTEDVRDAVSIAASPGRSRSGGSGSKRTPLGGLYSAMVQSKSGELQFSSPTKGARQLADMLRSGSWSSNGGATSSMSLVPLMDTPAFVEAPEVIRARERAVRAKKAQAEAIAAARLAKQAHAKKAAAAKAAAAAAGNAAAAGKDPAAGHKTMVVLPAAVHREPETMRRISSKRSVPAVQPPAEQQLQLVLVEDSPPAKRQKRINRKEAQVQPAKSRPVAADASPGLDID